MRRILEVLKVLEVMRRVSLWMLDAGGCGGRALFAGGIGDAVGDAFRATLYARGCGEWTLFAGGACDARGDALNATLYVGGCGGWVCLREVLEALEAPKVMRCVRLCMLGGRGG